MRYDNECPCCNVCASLCPAGQVGLDYGPSSFRKVFITPRRSAVQTPSPPGCHRTWRALAMMFRFTRRVSPLPAVLQAAAIAVICAMLWPPPAGAGSTGTVGLLTPNGSGAPTSDGDYISASVANGGLNAPYHFFLEVPAGLPRLVVELFDADVGIGGAAEALAQRDRARTTFDMAAGYTLFDPSGHQPFTFFNSGNATTPANTHTASPPLHTTKTPATAATLHHPSPTP